MCPFSVLSILQHVLPIENADERMTIKQGKLPKRTNHTVFMGSPYMGKTANHQPLVFNERGQLSQAILQFHVEPMSSE